MYTMSKTPEQDSLRAVGTLQVRSMLSATSRRFGVQCLISWVWWSFHQNKGNIVDLPRCGHLRVTSPYPDWCIVLSHQKDRLLPAIVTAANIPGLHQIRTLLWGCERVGFMHGELYDQHCNLITVLLIWHGQGSIFASLLCAGGMRYSPTNQHSSCSKLINVSMSIVDMESDMQTTASCCRFHTVLPWCGEDLLHIIALKSGHGK